MPTYDYVVLNEDGSDSSEVIEIIQSIRADALSVCPDTGRRIRRIISGTGPTIIIDPSKPRTLGTLAEQNTAKMIKSGDKRIKQKPKPPWWRDTHKPQSFQGWSQRKINDYIFKGPD